MSPTQDCSLSRLDKCVAKLLLLLPPRLTKALQRKLHHVELTK